MEFVNTLISDDLPTFGNPNRPISDRDFKFKFKLKLTPFLPEVDFLGA